METTHMNAFEETLLKKKNDEQDDHARGWKRKLLCSEEGGQ
jgi:hypothetical protein